MNPLSQFTNAAIGWAQLAGRRPGWQERFVTTREGLFVALGLYLAVVVLAILLQGLVSGTPSVSDLILGIAVNGLPLLGVSLALAVTMLLLRLKVPALSMLVPAIHALTLVLIVGFGLAFAGASLATALLGLLGYLLYRGGREILGLNIALAIAYAAFSIVLLVALPMTLYILMAPGGAGPI